MKKKKRSMIKNGIVKDLRSPKYKMQVQKDSKRSKLEKIIERLIKDYHVALEQMDD